MNGFVFVGGIWLGGVLSFFSPCIFPVLPVYLSILTAEPGSRHVRFLGRRVYSKPIVKTLFFIGGLSTVFISLGLGVGLLSTFVSSRYLPIIMGIVVIVLGLHQMELLNFRFMQNQKTLTVKKSRFDGYFGAYLLGFTFSFGWTPCIGPVLSAILAITLAGNQSFFGGALMAVYAFGLALPFLLLSILSVDVLQRFSKIKPHMGKIKKIGGGLLVLMGIVLLFDQLNFFTSLFT